MKKFYTVVSSTGNQRIFAGTQEEYYQHMYNTEEAKSSESYSFTALCPTRIEAQQLADDSKFAFVI